MADELKQAGLKITTPRILILEMLQNAALESNTEHLSAEEIYARLRVSNKDVGIATVYRVLTQFEQAGLIIKHNFEANQAVYELNEGEHHDHLCCVNCGAIVEFVDQKIEERQKKAAVDHGYKLVDHSLVLYGLCPNCQEAA
jgi:Fur family ferric uptake transcriptional regulator